MSGDPRSAREEAEQLVASVLAIAAAATRSFGAEHRTGERVSGGEPASGDRFSDKRGEPGLGGPGLGGAAGQPQPGFATGSAECCVCPLCRVIAAMREPDPEFAERVATGAGDLAAGLASVLRSFSGAAEHATHTAHAATGPRADAGAGATNGTSASNGAGTSGGAAAGSGARAGRPPGGPWPWSEFTWPRTDGGDDADDPWRAATRGAGPSPDTASRSAASQDTPSQGTKPMAKKAVKSRATAPPLYAEPQEPYAE